MTGLLPVISSWGRPLALPSYTRFESYELVDEVGYLAPSGKMLWAEPSGQTYLKLLSLDLNDPQAILAFVREHGILRGWRLFAEGGFDWLETYLPDELGSSTTSGRANDFATSVFAGNLVRARPQGGELLVWVHGETIDEFRFAASCLRAFIRIWLMYERKLEAPLAFDFPTAADVDPVRSAKYVLEGGMTAGLRSFAPRLEITHEEHSEHELRVTPAGEDRNPSRTLYEICCLELFNHIVTRANHRRCLLPECRKVFVFQEGNSRSPQYRSDAQFCTARHRWVAAKRAQRDRERAKPRSQKARTRTKGK